MIDRTEEGLEAITAKIDELEALLVRLTLLWCADTQ